MNLWSLLSFCSTWIFLWFESSSGNVFLDQGSSDRLIFSFLSLNTIELSDVISSLWAQSSWNSSIGQAGNLLLSLFDESYFQTFNIRTNNTSSDRFSFSFSGSFSSVAFSSWSEQKFDSGVGEDTLLHGESVSVKATSDFEDVTLEFVSQWIGLNLLSHSFLKEYSALIIIVNVDRFSSSVNRVWDWEL